MRTIAPYLFISKLTTQVLEYLRNLARSWTTLLERRKRMASQRLPAVNNLENPSMESNISVAGEAEDSVEVAIVELDESVLSKVFEYLPTDTLKSIRFASHAWSRAAAKVLSKRAGVINLKALGSDFGVGGSLEAYKEFEAARLSTPPEGGIIFSKFSINVERWHKKILDVVRAEWARNITELAISGFGPENTKLGFVQLILRKMPELKRLTLTLDGVVGTDYDIKEACLHDYWMRKEDRMFGLKFLKVCGTGEPGSARDTFDWSFCRFCPHITDVELVLNFCQPVAVFTSVFFENFRKEFQGKALAGVSIEICHCRIYSRVLVKKFVDFANEQELQALNLQVGIEDPIQLVEFLERSRGHLRRLSFKILFLKEYPHNPDLFSRILYILSGPNYGNLDHLTLDVSVIDGGANLEKVNGVGFVPQLLSVKHFTITSEANSIVYAQFLWLIQNLTAIMPNLESIRSRIHKRGDVKTILKAAGKYYPKLHTLELSCLGRNVVLSNSELFGKSEKRGAYRGLSGLPGLKKLELGIVQHRSCGVTTTQLFRGLLRCAALETVALYGVTRRVGNAEEELEFHALKQKLVTLKLLPSWQWQ